MSGMDVIFPKTNITDLSTAFYLPQATAHLSTDRGVRVRVVLPHKTVGVDLAIHNGHRRLLAGHRTHAQHALG